MKLRLLMYIPSGLVKEGTHPTIRTVNRYINETEWELYSNLNDKKFNYNGKDYKFKFLSVLSQNLTSNDDKEYELIMLAMLVPKWIYEDGNHSMNDLIKTEDWIRNEAEESLREGAEMAY